MRNGLAAGRERLTHGRVEVASKRSTSGRSSWPVPCSRPRTPARHLVRKHTPYRAIEIQEYGRGCKIHERGRADVDLRDKKWPVTRDGHRRVDARGVWAGGDGHHCWV